jgi:predicted nucleic acid-binding protein
MQLDNSFLSDLTQASSWAARQAVEWLIEADTTLGASAVAWTEFLRGSKGSGRDFNEVVQVKDMLRSGITPFGEQEAKKAAEMFNAIGRPKSWKDKRRMDCLIAASAILSDAELATVDGNHFEIFRQFGLKLTPT